MCAAWAAEGRHRRHRDAVGRVIVWDAKMMKEARRVEFGGRVLGRRRFGRWAYTAACVRGKQGGNSYVWETAKLPTTMKPVHSQPGDFGASRTPA